MSTGTYQQNGQAMKQYKGLFIPELVHYDKFWDCNNVYCSHIKCTECILYPTGEAVDKKTDYFNELRLGEW